MSAETKSFLLEKSPTAMLIMDLPEEPLTKAMKAKEARERKKAEQIADIESHMIELQASLAQENILVVERKQARETTKAALENLMDEQVWANKKIEPKQPQVSVENLREELLFLTTQIKARLDEMHDLAKQEIRGIVPIISQKEFVRLLLEKLPKRQRAVMEGRYSPQFEQIKTLGDHLSSTIEDMRLCLKQTPDAFEKKVLNNISTFQDVSSSKLPLPSQPSSSPSAIIPTPSTSSINLCSEPTTQGC